MELVVYNSYFYKVKIFYLPYHFQILQFYSYFEHQLII